MKHSKVLITGGAGFIGSAVVRQFVRETETTALDIVDDARGSGAGL